ncbi:MAG: branched-chain amino acid ABC transporter permease [Thermodesulfobacteriota bacterium]
MAQMIISGLALGAIYGLVALGIVLVHKSTAVLNFAHGEMIMVCTFVTLALIGWGLPLWLAIILTLVIAAIIGLVIERILIQKLIGAPLLSTALVCLGLFLILGDVAVWIWGKEIQVFPTVFSEKPFRLGQVFLSPADLGIIIICVLLSLLLFVFFRSTKLGLAMVATMDNQTAARLMGIPVRKVWGLSWMLASMVGAVAGILIAPIIYLHFTFMQSILHFAFAAAVLGGINSLPGAVVGGLILGVVTNLVGIYISSELKEALPFLIMLSILMIRPRGLFAGHVEKKV